MLLLHKLNIKSYKHKIILNYNGATVEVFLLLNSERGLWYDGRCVESARHFRIESESSD